MQNAIIQTEAADFVNMYMYICVILKTFGLDCICLLLRNEDAEFPNNYCVTVQHALNLKRKLSKNPQFCEDYTKFMQTSWTKALQCQETHRITAARQFGIFQTTGYIFPRSISGGWYLTVVQPIVKDHFMFVLF